MCLCVYMAHFGQVCVCALLQTLRWALLRNVPLFVSERRRIGNKILKVFRMSFIFKCTHCGADLEGEEEWRGMRTECPICKYEIDIPPTEPVND